MIRGLANANPDPALIYADSAICQRAQERVYNFCFVKFEKKKPYQNLVFLYKASL